LLFTSAMGLVSAQSATDATSLVADIATFARQGSSWLAEGSFVTEEAGVKLPSAEQFRIAYQLAPSIRARLEAANGENRLLRVCDGASRWTYYSNINKYVRVLLPQIGPCAWPINAWPPLWLTLRAPMVAGTDRLMLEGRLRECYSVHGEFVASTKVPKSGQSVTMCVDPVTKLIIRYKMEQSIPPRKIQTTTFSLLQRDPKLDPDLFQFHPPAGSKQIAVINWLDPIAQPSNSAIRVSNDALPPDLVKIVVPENNLEASEKSSGGAVVLSLEVNADGATQNIKVVRSLGGEQDEKAVEALKQWRFAPAGGFGKIVPVVTAVAMIFR
jgi:TonB family protein